MKPVKKILMLSHEFPPFGGGEEGCFHACVKSLGRGVGNRRLLTAAPPLAIDERFPFKVVYFSTFRKARFKTSVPAMALYLAQVVLYCLSGKARGHDILFF